MIVVTGASRGLGKQIKIRLQEKGEEVLGIARRENLSEDIMGADISKFQDIKKVVIELKKEKKKVTALINAAGIASMNLAITTPELVTKKIIETNLLGTIFSNQLFLPLIIRSGGGQIINFSTIAVKLGLKGESIYVASKAGVEGFTRSFAREVSDFNITVNCIAPGPIKTNLLKGISDNQIKKITDQQIFTKIFSEKEVYEVVDLLLSENARYISGQVIPLGGS